MRIDFSAFARITYCDIVPMFRRGTLRRTSTIDRSAPLLREATPTIPVPTTHPKEDQNPGGSWENVLTAPPPEPLERSWDCVEEIVVNSSLSVNSLSVEHTQ